MWHIQNWKLTKFFQTWIFLQRDTVRFYSRVWVGDRPCPFEVLIRTNKPAWVSSGPCTQVAPCVESNARCIIRPGPLFIHIGQMFCREISRSFEATRLDVRIIISPWNSTDGPAVLLPGRLSNFKVIWDYWYKSRDFHTVRDFTITHVYHLANREVHRHGSQF